MFDLIKKTLLTGVGLAVISREKAEAMAREVADAAKLSSEKGQEFVDEVVGKSEKMRKELEETVQRAVHESLKRADLPTRDDIAQLRARIEELERTVASQMH
ncbi:MAG: phasin family protein [Phycisphaerae bacterium]